MPYITQDKRDILDAAILNLVNQIQNASPNNDGREGNLNYTITSILLSLYGDPSYAKINNMIGVLECAKLELYRRYAAIYEDQKITQNGDVYSK